ncbi:MAG: PQQ-like beta-propeller repeat protein [Bryobacteraceae bacterium]|nr:PQQ-like beta-propeller repeat protein [Bryobacteraceae bacterium]
MMNRIFTGALAACLLGSTVQAENWPQWRGPLLSGISNEKDLPVTWSQTENIAWKLEMPAWSGATPIVWDNHIFLNVAEGENLYLWAVDRNKGTVLWKRSFGGGNVKMQKQNMSSPSPVTDGKTVWSITGTGILKAFDYSGKELWSRNIQKDYGAFGLNHGYASSPLLHDGYLYIQVLHGMKTDDPSYILKIDGKSGKTIWRVERPTTAERESPDSYATPMLLKNGKDLELVVLGGDCITGHDLATGKELWRGGGLNPDNNPFYRMVASPVVWDGVVYAPTRVKPLTAFKAGGRGDITTSHRLWQFNNGPDVPTPVTDGKYFYSINDRGIVYCLDAKTGKEIYGGKRIKPGTYSASPVLADGKIYITSEEGITTVLKAGPEFEILAENNMNEYTLSTIAISDGQLFLRTDKYLYAIGQRRK